MRRCPERCRDDLAAILDDRQVGRLAVEQRLTPQARGDPQDQVVLGLARGKERARLLDERLDVLVTGQLHPRHIDGESRVGGTRLSSLGQGRVTYWPRNARAEAVSTR